MKRKTKKVKKNYRQKASGRSKKRNKVAQDKKMARQLTPQPKREPFTGEVFCTCGNQAELTDSSIVYKKSYGNIWHCKDCGNYVGVHKATNQPLGILANEATRRARKVAHHYFDQLWRGKKNEKLTRKFWYASLAQHLSINFQNCHMGLFDEATCKEVAEFAKENLKNINI